jgi:hypothetical protein
MTTLATDGLIAVGSRLTFDTAPGSATVISATINPQFNKQMVLDGGTNFSRINNPAGTADIAGTLLLDPPIKASSILVGTYSFFGNAVGVTNVTTGIPIDPGVMNYNVTDPGATLDSTITPMSTTITTIPEVSSFVFLSIVSLLGGLGTVFTRHRKSVAKL